MNQIHALIIDDNANNVQILADLLSDEGVTSVEVLNVNDLDRVLENPGKVDVVFLDLEFRGVDGHEIFAKLKTYDKFQSIPIVAYTVHVSEITKAHQLGYHSFLCKPLDSD